MTEKAYYIAQKDIKMTTEYIMSTRASYNIVRMT